VPLHSITIRLKMPPRLNPSCADNSASDLPLVPLCHFRTSSSVVSEQKTGLCRLPSSGTSHLGAIEWDIPQLENKN
jgi:hypothetical protein